MTEDLKVLLVEDDEIMAMDISARLKRIGHTVVSAVDSGVEAIEFIRGHLNEIDIILMDVLLNGKIDGIDANQKILKLETIPTIILTGFSDNNTVQRAKMPNIIGYILKPCSDHDLTITIELGLYNYYREYANSTEIRTDKADPDDQFLKNPMISLWAGEGMVVINVTDICYLEIRDGVVTIQTDSGQFFERGTLKEWETRLIGRSFFRCHKNYLINIRKVTRLTPCMDNSYLISLSCSKNQIPLSRHKVSQFHDQLLN